MIQSSTYIFSNHSHQNENSSNGYAVLLVSHDQSIELLTITVVTSGVVSEKTGGTEESTARSMCLSRWWSA